MMFLVMTACLKHFAVDCVRVMIQDLLPILLVILPHLFLWASPKVLWSILLDYPEVRIHSQQLHLISFQNQGLLGYPWSNQQYCQSFLLRLCPVFLLLQAHFSSAMEKQQHLTICLAILLEILLAESFVLALLDFNFLLAQSIIC